MDNTFKHIQVIDDGGTKVLQAVITLGEICELIDSGRSRSATPARTTTWFRWARRARFATARRHRG